VPRRNLLVVTQSLATLLAFALSALTFSGLVRPWHIIVLAFVLEMVDRRDLTNAIALAAPALRKLE